MILGKSGVEIGNSGSRHGFQEVRDSHATLATSSEGNSSPHFSLLRWKLQYVAVGNYKHPVAFPSFGYNHPYHCCVLFPNRYKQGVSPRSHNGVKLLNECLARHQLSYFTFFFTLAIAANFDAAFSWIRNFVWFSMTLSLIFYGEGVYSNTHQDENILKHHTCTGSKCTISFPFRQCLRLCGITASFAFLSLLAGILFAFLARPVSQ